MGVHVIHSFAPCLNGTTLNGTTIPAADQIRSNAETAAASLRGGFQVSKKL
jgi:hypothetical protein